VGWLGFDCSDRRGDLRRHRWLLPQGGLLLEARAMPSGLFTAVFLAIERGPVALTCKPDAPDSRRFSALGAAVAFPGLARREPAFAPFEKTAAAAGVPTARAERLTRHQGFTKLGSAHGRDLLPSGQAAGSCHFPPPLCADSWTALVGNRAARSS